MTVNSISHRVAELGVCIAKRYQLKIVQVYASTSYSEEYINSFHNDVDEILVKPNHYTVVVGDFIAQIGNRTNSIETATDTFGQENPARAVCSIVYTKIIIVQITRNIIHESQT